VIPTGKITPQAASLLGYYPAPNDSTGHFYQTPTVVSSRQDSGQLRLSHTLNTRNQIFGNLAFQRSTTKSTNVFGFTDSTVASGIDTAANWSHRFSMFLTLRTRYQFTRLSNDVTPYFASRTNVSGAAAIAGNSQDAVNWGPPNLVFSSGLAGIGDAQYARNHNRTHAWNGETLWSHGRHSVTSGGDVKLMRYDIFSQQDARGTFSFNGSASGSDFADFLLGSPHSSSIAFGNPDKLLRQEVYDAYVSDDWRVSPSLTLTLGLRWEYETPVTERYNRLSNLDVAPQFSAATTVVATSAVGATTGIRYPDSLLKPDRRGIQPRIGVAWRPVPGSSLVVRGGYGIYRNTNVYEPIALLLAQQPPLSKTASLENSVATPLTLANGFPASGGSAANTFGVDPDFRVGSAHNWQVSAQRDLPASLTMVATYLGTHGSHLMQEFLPNTYPVGAANPCPTCPIGFVYLSSNGHSTRNAAQLQIRRRLRNGFSATTQYTLAQARDDAGAFTGVGLGGSAIAQDWRNLDGEWAPSNFDQRHLLTAQVQYTTGIGVAGGALLEGLKGTLLKGWTVTAQLSAGSGLPLTPVYLTSVPGTAVVGSIRANVTGASASTPSTYYLDPAAYAAPGAGQWGNAGRNSARGPAQFSLNSGIARTFTLSPRLYLDWRIDATNVLNRVTFSGVNTTVGSPQFGLANRANTMRKLQSTIRMRF
jgi:hypothetical protein